MEGSATKLPAQWAKMSCPRAGPAKDRWKIAAAMVVEIGGEKAVRQLAARMVAGVGVGSFSQVSRSHHSVGK